jgi:hypothetical protein
MMPTPYSPVYLVFVYAIANNETGDHDGYDEQYLPDFEYETNP